ncbi:MAG: hypothetical protein P3X22_000990 [Thermoprotei archaeon]|nr:hypothetical protein [Thermoprotei archaeon]
MDKERYKKLYRVYRKTYKAAVLLKEALSEYREFTPEEVEFLLKRYKRLKCMFKLSQRASDDVFNMLLAVMSERKRGGARV